MMIIGEEVSSELRVFKSQAVNSTSVSGFVIQIDERLRWEGTLYTLCTTLSFVMLILITSFVYFEANRSLLDSPSLRVIDVQSTLKETVEMGKTVTSSVPAIKIKDIASIALGKCCHFPKGISTYIVRVMHWIARQMWTHSSRAIKIIRVSPVYLRGLNEALTTSSWLNTEQPQGQKIRQSFKATSPKGKFLSKRKVVMGGSGSGLPSPYVRKTVIQGSLIEIMGSSTKDKSSLPQHVHCHSEKLNAVNPPNWRKSLSDYKQKKKKKKRKKKNTSVQSKSCQSSTSLCTRVGNHDICLQAEHIVFDANTKQAAPQDSTNSDDSWRELCELIDQTVNSPSRPSSLSTCCTNSYHTTPGCPSFTISETSMNDQFINQRHVGFSDVELMPPSNVLGTLLSWNNIWSNAEHNVVPDASTCTFSSRFFPSIKASIASTAAGNATSQLDVNDHTTSATSNVIWPLPEKQQGQQVTSSRELGRINIPSRTSSASRPIGSLRKRRIGDEVAPSIWSPIWQPSSGDPEFAMTFPLMLQFNIECDPNQRSFPTFLQTSSYDSSRRNGCFWTDASLSRNTAEEDVDTQEPDPRFVSSEHIPSVVIASDVSEPAPVATRVSPSESMLS